MGVKGDNVPFAGVHEGTESPKKVAKRRSSLCGRSGLTDTQATRAASTKAFRRPWSRPDRKYGYPGKNKGRKQVPPLNHILLFRRKAVGAGESVLLVPPLGYSALGLVSPDRPQSSLRCFALIFTPGVTLL